MWFRPFSELFPVGTNYAGYKITNELRLNIIYDFLLYLVADPKNLHWIVNK